jgi:beta-glucosidase
VAVQAGSAVISSEWIDAVPAVVQSWYAGCQAGPGLADVLVGAVGPSGRLPFSVPVDEGDLPPFDRDATHFRYDRWHGWWHLERAGTTPAFPFGFGLGYTTFVLAGADVARDGDSIVVTGSVRNTGARGGADVVQVYVELPDPDAPPRLGGFARVEVAAGEEAPFRVVVPVDRLATRDPERRAWRAATGPHRVRVARFAGDPRAVVVDVVV